MANNTTAAAEIISLRQQVQAWKEVCRKVGHALHAQNAEQIESPEVAESMLLRQIRWNNDETSQTIAKLREPFDNPVAYVWPDTEENGYCSICYTPDANPDEMLLVVKRPS